MRECILHIGMRKTGSTSIQQSLGSATSLQGLRYVRFGTRLNASNSIEAAFAAPKPDADEAHQLLDQGKRTKLIEQLESQLAAAPGPDERFLLSGERLHRLDATELAALRKVLERHVDRVRVVAYVREAAGFVNSLFQQHVKLGGRLDVAKLERVMPEYRENFERFDQAFGPENVTLWRFAPASFVRGDVVHDFCHRLGASIDDADVRRDNEGLCRDAIGLLHTYRHLGLPRQLSLGQQLQIKALVDAMGSLKGGKLSFSPAVLQPQFDAHQADLAWIAQRMGESLAAMPAERPDAIHGEADLLRPTPAALDWLIAQMGRSVELPEGHEAAAQYVSGLMAELAERLAPNAEEAAAEHQRLQKAIRKSAARAVSAEDKGEAAKARKQANQLRKQAQVLKRDNRQERNAMLDGEGAKREEAEKQARKEARKAEKKAEKQAEKKAEKQAEKKAVKQANKKAAKRAEKQLAKATASSGSGA